MAKGQMNFDADACADKLGCTLLQQQPGGARLPVSYWSRGLSPARKKLFHYGARMPRRCVEHS